MLTELIGMCRQTVRLALACAERDGYGELSYGANTQYRARVVNRLRPVRNFAGEEVISSTTIYFAATPSVGAHDRITLSTSDAKSTETGALTPPLLNALRAPDEFGRTSLTVFLG